MKETRSRLDMISKIGIVLCIVGLGFLATIPILVISFNWWWLGTIGWFLFMIPFILGFGMLGYSWAASEEKKA
jgi:hypothetical protein